MELTHEERTLRDALSQINTPAYDMEGAVRQAISKGAPARRRRLPRAGLLAAALVAALVIGAAAAGFSGLWERFFPNPVPQNAVTTIGASQTSGDYTLTLEDAMADDNGVILLLTLSRADGQKIDPAARLSSNFMRAALWTVNSEARGGFDRPPLLSEDGKSLRFCFEARSNQLSGFVGLSGKRLTFTVDGVAIPLQSPNSIGVVPEETADLSPLAGLDTLSLSTTSYQDFSMENDMEPARVAIEAQNISLPLPLDEEFPQYAVLGAVTLKEGLAVALTLDQGRNGDRLCTDVMPEALIDTRDGARYDMEQGSGFALSTGSRAMLYTFRDCPLTAEDLPRLRLEVHYEIDQILSEEPFSITFTPDSGSAMIFQLDKTAEVAGEQLLIQELRLSALSVNIRFGNPMEAVSNSVRATKTAPVITLKDGGVLSTVWQGGSGGPDACNVGFQAQDKNGQRLFLDTEQIASVTLNGVTLWSAP